MIKSGRRTFMVLLLVTFVLMVTIVVIIVASRNVYDPIELQGTFIHEHNIFEHIFLVFDEGTFRTYGRVAEELTQGEPRLMYWGQGILVASDDGTYYTMYAEDSDYLYPLWYNVWHIRQVGNTLVQTMGPDDAWNQLVFDFVWYSDSVDTPPLR